MMIFYSGAYSFVGGISYFAGMLIYLFFSAGVRLLFRDFYRGICIIGFSQNGTNIAIGEWKEGE